MRYLTAAVVLAIAALARADEKTDFFEKQIRPLLTEHCYKCHGDGKPKGGLRLTSRAELLKGGDSGAVVTPGKPNESLLLKAVGYGDDQLKMPPKGKLPQRDIDALSRWVAIGLPWSDDKTAGTASQNQFTITDEQRRFWSFQPIRRPPVPSVGDLQAPANDLDRFIIAKLEANGLRLSPSSDKRTLIRRATFDLTGLPPTPGEVDAFLKDESPQAFARVVDRLLASPAYGERWGRHWLDLVRYADSLDSRGLGSEGDIADAWRYRDWVVTALNRDLPYDQFVKMQIAGDLQPGWKPGEPNLEGIVATGMLAIGNWGGGDADKEKLLTDIADDQVDVVCRTFMGLTVACARCHDHKFDPISTKDYYALAGIFFSTHILPNVGPKTGGPPMLRIPLESAAEKDQRSKLAIKAQELERELKRQTELRYSEFARQMLPQTAEYILAAAEFRQQQGKNIDVFAAERELHSFTLRRWAEALAGGEDRLMQTKVRDVLGYAGIHGWRGAPDCPSLLVNTTDRETKILTFKLPPKSVAVHPGPKSGVVLAWKSPVAGKILVRGELIDADPQCGDGVAWALDLRQNAGRRELATGEFANGSRQKLSDGKNGANLAAIEVAAGDVLELVVLPKLDYTCDTTLVDLTISTADGSKSWTAATDLLDDIHSGNPHKDAYGNRGVWSFADMGERQRGAQPLPELNGWRQLPANASSIQQRQVAAEIQKEFSRVDSTSPFWIGSAEQESALPADARAQLAALRKELDAAKKAAAAPAKFANGAQEGGVPGSPHAGVHDVHVHIRGRYDRLGDMAPRRFPEILAGPQSLPALHGSGRRELADWLTRPDHPLTARVMANRLWQYHFGEGLVRTPSNFGKLGERPTHPELLDWLATEFVQSGWSIKQMHRLIMLSATYRQSAECGVRNAESSSIPHSALRTPHSVDPENRLLWHMNRRRLEAEALRDNLLAVSGRLDRTTGGPATRDFNNPRRSLYQMTVRSDRSGFGPLFDVADPTALIDRRTVSTVAPQALFLLNNPFVIDDVRALSERLQKSAPKDEERIRQAYGLLYARPPSADEERVGLNFLHSQPADSAWFAYCQVLLCANEFVYVD